MSAKTDARTLRRGALACALSLLFAGTAHAGADAPLPRDLPPFAPDKPLPVADIVQRTLDNGLQVWVVPRDGVPRVDYVLAVRSEEHTSELQSLMRISYAVFCLKTKKENHCK